MDEMILRSKWLEC